MIPKKALPLTGFRLLENPDHPTTPILEMRTAEGPQLFLMRKDILAQMGQFLITASSATASKKDAH